MNRKFSGNCTTLSEKFSHESDIMNEDYIYTRTAKSEQSILWSSYKILLLKDVAEDEELRETCQLFNVPVSVASKFEKGSEEVLSVYVVQCFDGIKKNGSNYRILGRTALLELAEKKEQTTIECSTFSKLRRPLYCHSLSGQVICFDGFEKKERELRSLILLVHHMGGSVREEANIQTTLIVAKLCEGEKYKYAVTFRLPVVCEAWIYDAWEKRNIVGFNAADTNFVSKYKLKPFHGAKICFLGFPDDEKNHMIEILRENGGQSVDLYDSACTHLVVDESKINATPPVQSNRTFVVKAEWFWASVQYEGRKDELDFIFEEAVSNSKNITPLSLNGTPLGPTSSGGRNRKRKRQKDAFSSFNSNLSPDMSAHKRRSSASNATRLSEGSFLDYSIAEVLDESIPVIQDKTVNSARYHKFLELYQTETNYVGILNTIMTLFKDALEQMVGDKEQLLNATELKIIFGHLPPIYATHCCMLEELKIMAAQWNDENSIGNLILKYSADLLKSYPPFINFFENTRDMLINCDRNNPRFHAFLKVCQSKPECGRQSLQDLLIRPVQRLPSINLLLNDILRYTSNSSIDYEALQSAISSIQDVMAHINEDKRKTENQVALFDIFNDIENCPAHLVSSHRCFISRCEATELSDNLSGKGNSLVLFLFSDVIEVCKKRAKAFNNFKSPKDVSSTNSKHGNVKLYKHVKLLPLASVVKVIDIKETEECQNIFALMVKNCIEIKESKTVFYSFTVTDDSIAKVEYLRLLCNQIANIVCRTDTENYLMCLEAQHLDINSSEVSTSALGKALKFATKTRLKVERALSFNKTPGKLKRAVSTMISPFANGIANGIASGLTPTAAHFRNLHLAALPPIPKSNNALPETPTSVQPTRKNKSMSFSMGSLRRL